MTLTIAERWRLTFKVQSLARVTYPAPPPKPVSSGPDLLAVDQARRLHEELEAQRHHWEYEALFSCRRTY